MELDEHGGGCCGISNIFDMDFRPDGGRLAELDSYLGQMGRNRLAEVVLAGNQLNNGWPAALQARGFRLVSLFENSNSNNTCAVFHHVPVPIPLDTNNFGWDLGAEPHDAERAGVVPPVPAPAPEPRVVFSTFHNVLRTGRSDAGFSTRAAAAAAARAASIDRRDVYASGHVRWTTNV